MAKNQTETETETKRGRGRPPSSEISDEERLENARGALQKAVDTACAKIADNPSGSYMARAARCVRLGYPRERVMAGFDAMEAAVKEARETIVALYERPEVKAPVKQRVVL